MSLAVQQYVDAAEVASKITATQYRTRLKFFGSFVSEKYNCTIDDLIANLKAAKNDVYEVLNGFAVFLSKRGDKANLMRAKIITARNFLESNDIDVHPRKFKLKVRMPKAELVHKEALDKN